MAVEEEGGASAWQIPTLVLHERLSTYDAVPKEVREVRSPDDRIVVELGDTAAIVDRASGRRLGELPLRPVVAVAFSPDGLRIAVADGSPDVRIYRRESYAPLEELITMARKHAGRELTREERVKFVPPTLVQSLIRMFRPGM